MRSSDLLSRYLQAVGFWLPRATKNDILAEISEDLHSQIEERAAELNRPLNDAEIAEILKQRGRPVVVAGTFLPQRQLIGPVLFPIYIFVLKIVALCYLLPWFLVWVGFMMFDRPYLLRHGGELGSLSPLFSVVWILFGVITFIFAILDRSSNRDKIIFDWDPRKLPKLKPGASTTKAKDIAGIAFLTLGFVWLLAVPSHPFLVLGPAALFIKFAPIWRSAYPWLLVAAVAGIAENAVGLRSNTPAWVRPVLKLANAALFLGIIFLLSRDHTYFLAQSEQTVRWIPTANSIAYLALIGNAIGFAIAFVIHAWALSRWNVPPTDPSAA